MVGNFFEETFALYPRSSATLQRGWIADACVEALGLEAARDFLGELLRAPREEVPERAAGVFLEELASEKQWLEAAFHPPLALLSAVQRFSAWEALEPEAPLSARETMTRGLERVYRLDRFPEIVRYHLHRQTTFARSDLPAREAFDALLIAMFRQPGVWPAQMVELAEVQASLGSAEERLAFGRLVFPDSAPDKDVALAAVGEGGRHVVATTHTADRTGARYTVRDPHDPAELGRLVQLLVRSGVPRASRKATAISWRWTRRSASSPAWRTPSFPARRHSSTASPSPRRSEAAASRPPFSTTSARDCVDSVSTFWRGTCVPRHSPWPRLAL